MRIKTNKVLLLTLVLVMIFSTSVTSFASSVNVNGKDQSLTIETRNGRSYISTESLTSFGFATEIKGQTVIVKNNNVTFTFFRDTNRVNVNEAELTLDSKAYTKNGVAYIPMKFFFETINYEVGWTAATKKVTLYKMGDLKFPVVIQDGDLNYKFDKAASKVVSLAPSVTEILFAIGAGNHVIGRTIYCDYPSKASSIQTIGTLYEPDLEGILDLNPEVVIAATHMNADVMDTLKKAGIQIATQKSPGKINEIYTFISKLGILVDHQYEARALVSSLKLKEDRVKEAVAMIPASERKTVYYVVATGKSEYSAGNGTFINEVLQEAGGKNIAADVSGWAYSLEKLIEHNPYYIFGESFAYDTMKGSDNYKSLDALKNNRFITIDSHIYSIPGPRVIDQGMKFIIHTLYPDYEKYLNY